MYQQTLKRIPIKIWMLPIIALAFITRLYHLGTQSLWFDEIVIVAVARLPWYTGLLAAIEQGIQLTPVFHGIVKLWLIVGDSDWLARLPAVFFGILTLPLVFKVGQLYFNNKVGLLAAFIFAINPYQVWYSQELKLYALLPFIGAGAMYAFGLMVKTNGRRGVILLTLFNVIGLPAHYFMFLISTVQFLYLIMTLKHTHILLRRWIIAQIIGVLPLALWWLFIIQQQHFAFGIGWIPTPQWFAPFLTFWNLTYVYTGEWSTVTIIALPVMFIGLILGLRGVWGKPKQGSLLTLWLFFPPLIVFILSFGRSSFYADRYFLIVSPILTLLIISGLLSFCSRRLQWSLLLIFVLATGLGLWKIYFDQENFSKKDWRTLARTLDTQAQPGQVVVTCTDGHWLSLEYYNPHQNLKPQNVTFAAEVENISASNHVAWVIQTHPGISPHHLAKTNLPVLNTSLLSPDAADWQIKNLQTTVNVSGISAYKYDITDLKHLSEIVNWSCKG